MSQPKTGVSTVVAEIVTQSPLVPGADVEQLNLADLIGMPALRPSSKVVPKRAGRPVNAQNKRTEEVRRWLLSQFGDPVARLAAMANMGIDEIADRLKCKPLEAAQLWKALQESVAAYTHQKMPAMVKVEQTRRVRIVRDAQPGDDAVVLDGEGRAIVDQDAPPPSGGEGEGGGE